MLKCRCGKQTLDDTGDSLIINDYQHDGFAVVNGFCGPVYKHQLYNRERQLEESMAHNEKLQFMVSELVDQVTVLEAELKGVKTVSLEGIGFAAAVLDNVVHNVHDYDAELSKRASNAATSLRAILEALK